MSAQDVTYAREKSASVGRRPCGVYLSTASGSSRQSLVSNSSRDRPVCVDKVSNTSGPIARCSWAVVHGSLGPVLTQDSAVWPWPLCLKRSISSASPLLRTPVAPAPPTPIWLSKPPTPPCPSVPGFFCPSPLSISAILSLFW